MSDFISVRRNPIQNDLQQSQKLDLLVFLNVAPKYVARDVDIIEVIRLLQAYGYITRDLRQELTVKYLLEQNSNQSKFSKLLLKLLTLLTLKKIARFLKTLGYDEFAIELIQERYGAHADVLQGANIGLTEEILTYYATLKSYMDDNVFNDRRTALEIQSRNILRSIDARADQEDKQLAVNKYVVVTFLRATLYKLRDDRQSILEEMIRNIPNDVDSRFANIVYNGKMAITAIRAGDDHAALEYAKRAITLCDNCEQQFVKVFAYHDQQFVYRCLFSTTPSEEHLKNILTSGQLGLDVLMSLAGNKAMIWRKALTTENAMSLLKIKNDFSVMYEQSISECDREAAERFIQSLDRSAGGSQEKRTAMKTALCKARINERRDPGVARYYSQEAVKLAQEGSHFVSDLLHITMYNDYIHSNVGVTPI
ncbi:hypothetical protein ACF0H5_021418 [Mactra antiquata]